MTKDIYEMNVRQLQAQLHKAYAHIDELNQIKEAAKNVVVAQTELSDYAHYNPKLANRVCDAINDLSKLI